MLSPATLVAQGARVAGGLPGPLAAVGAEAGQLAKAAGVLALARLVRQGLQHHRSTRKHRPQLRRMRTSVNGESALLAAASCRLPSRWLKMLRQRLGSQLADCCAAHWPAAAVLPARLPAVESLLSADAERGQPAQPPVTAADYAQVYSAEVKEMRRMLRVGMKVIRVIRQAQAGCPAWFRRRFAEGGG